MTAETILETTVRELFGRLAAEGIRYAVLRNHEDFPRFGRDVDIVLSHDDLDAWRRIAVEVAGKLGWDLLTECAHQAGSRSGHHHVEILRFYRLDPLVCFQVDVFHAHVVFSLPFRSETELMDGRVSGHGGDWFRLAPRQEHLYYLFQIHSLRSRKDSEAKRKQYRDRVATFERSSQGEFRRHVRQALGAPGEIALSALVDGNEGNFSRAMGVARAFFFAKRLFSRPGRTIRDIASRAEDRYRAFLTNPCGIVLKVPPLSPAEGEALHEALRLLVEAKLIRVFHRSQGTGRRAYWKERRVLERGGVVVTEKAGAAFDVTGGPSRIAHRIATILIARHPALYTRLPGNASFHRGKISDVR